MLPSAQTLPLDIAGGTMQLTETKGINVDGVSPDSGFSALMKRPASLEALPLPVDISEALPDGGNALPVPGTTSAGGNVTTPLPTLPAAGAAVLQLETGAQGGPDPAAAGAEPTDGIEAADAGTLTYATADLAIRMPASTANEILPWAPPGNPAAQRSQEDRPLSLARPPVGPGSLNADGTTGPVRPLDTSAADGIENAPVIRFVTTPDRAAAGQHTGPGGSAPAIEDLIGQRPGEPFVMPDLAARERGEILPTQLPPGPSAVSAAELTPARDPAAAARLPTVVTTSIDQPLSDDSWGEALQDRVLWMTSRKIQSAEIRLNPSELGPIRIQVSVEDDAAVISFTAQHNATREAIEQAMPRLREMLNDNGLTLAGSTVGDAREDQQGQGGAGTGAADPAEIEHAAVSETEIESGAPPQSAAAGLVDTFA